ncbi:MAG: hypothetical protein KC416_13170 [Myxococcales bacterium]|nr:hypothetical protein [Myxococcales bacterium]
MTKHLIPPIALSLALFACDSDRSTGPGGLGGADPSMGCDVDGGCPGTGPGTDPNGEDPGNPGQGSVAVLGGGTHVADGLTIEELVSAADGLSIPRDLALNPERPDELWIVNRGGNATVVVTGLGTPAQQSSRRAAAGASHFMAQPAALAFGDPGIFATALEEDQITQPTTPADFMGPTLWTADLAIFDGGHGGHLDMLHNSPNGVGIAWDKGNAYFLFDGYHQSITWYDFAEDHGPGGSYHGDGTVIRYVEGEVAYAPDIPSHMEKDAETGLLYVADTGNQRIAVLDITNAVEAGPTAPNYDGGKQVKATGASLTTLVDGQALGTDDATLTMSTPSGLELHDGMIFVTDNATSRIFAFDKGGRLIDWLSLAGTVKNGSLMGLTFDSAGRILIVDAWDNRVLRIAAP